MIPLWAHFTVKRRKRQNPGRFPLDMTGVMDRSVNLCHAAHISPAVFGLPAERVDARFRQHPKKQVELVWNPRLARSKYRLVQGEASH
jgi:hypothetical protein